MDIATKSDLKNEIATSERRIIRRLGVVKNDLAGRIASLATPSPTIREFNKLKAIVEARYIS